MTKYAIGAGGVWTADTTWSTTSGGANDTTKPTAADDVVLDANSGAVTISATAVGRSLDCTGYTNTLTHNNSITLSLGDGTAGAGNIALKLVAGMTYTVGGTSASLVFLSTSGTVQTIDYAGKATTNITFSGAGSSYQLTGTLAGGSRTISHTAGTLDFNGRTISCIFSSTGTTTRSLIDSGAATITLGYAFTATLWQVTGSGFTVNIPTTTINCSHANSTFNGGNGCTYGTIVFSKSDESWTNLYFVGGTSTYVAVNYTGTPTMNIGGGTITTLLITGTNQVNINNDISLTTLTAQSFAAAKTINVTAGKTLTIASAAGFVVNGSSGKLVTLQSATAGTQWNLVIASGTTTCNYLSIKDSAASGGATFNPGANSVYVSNNTGWAFTRSSALTGTITSAVEADIISGGKTIILTLTNDDWVASGATFDAQRQNIINGLDSAQAEAAGWDAVVKAGLAVTDVARTSSTVVTVTLPAFASYAITADETITATIPSTALVNAGAIVASPTFAISNQAAVTGMKYFGDEGLVS